MRNRANILQEKRERGKGKRNYKLRHQLNALREL